MLNKSLCLTNVPLLLLMTVSLEAQERFEARRVVMGSEARVLLFAADEELAMAAADAAFARLGELDACLSDYREDSELALLCARAGGGPVVVSVDLFSALEKAQRMAAVSQGAFDVTVGPLVRLWRLEKALADGEGEADPGIDEADWVAARALVGMEKLKLDGARRTVELTVAGMQLDLGGIGKGLACDAAVAVLRDHGVTSALVEIGGDMAIGDAPPGAAGWVVQGGCEGDAMRPDPMTVSHVGVATSGDTERFLVRGGERLSHVLDPRAGAPLSGRGCVTAVAADGATADALATAASVLPAREARQMAWALPGATVHVPDVHKRPLFDGKSLDGWVTRGGRYDGNARWSVEDGAITGRVGEEGAGGLIYTEEKFSSFELELEVWMNYPFDSGVFLRMAPEGKGAQVTLDHRPGGEIGAIYADGFLEHNRSAGMRYVRGGWNHVEVRCTGFDMRIEVWLNGVLVTDHQVTADVGVYAPCGLIGLQVHGDRADPPEHAVRFRNVAIRELPSFGEEGADSPQSVGSAAWRSLFDGESLEGWKVVGDAGGVRVAGGAIEVLAANGGGHLETIEDFSDFELSMEFQISKMANSGVFLRAARDGSNPAYSGCEVQILDDFDWEEVTGDELKPWQFTGSLYGSVAPGLQALRPLGEWNRFEMLYRGSRLAVALNGRTLYDVDTLTVDGKPFAERAASGFIGLQLYPAPHAGDEVTVRFRNLRVR